MSFYSYHCFHFAPVICLQVWEDNWVTPRPKCFAGGENEKDDELWIQDLIIYSCERRREKLRSYSSRLKRPECCFFFLFPRLHAPDTRHPAQLVSHTHTQQCVVLLCHLATCLATVPLLSKQKHVMISGCDLFLKEGIHM